MRLVAPGGSSTATSTRLRAKQEMHGSSRPDWSLLCFVNGWMSSWNGHVPFRAWHLKNHHANPRVVIWFTLWSSSRKNRVCQDRAWRSLAATWRIQHGHLDNFIAAKQLLAQLYCQVLSASLGSLAITASYIRLLEDRTIRNWSEFCSQLVGYCAKIR